MEGEEEIGLVLARASDLRSRISACAAAARPPLRLGAGEEDDGGEEAEEEVEMESLVGINDALESLERQLASLQDLQHQQRYERETVLSQIDRSRTSLLNKLKEYKGEDCEAIHEAAAFAGEKIENDDGLILPPYSGHVTNSFVLDDLYPANYVSKPKCLHNGLRSNGMTEDAVMIVGAVSIMKAAGYEPTIGRSGIKLDIAGLLGKEAAGAKEQVPPTLQCPPGKADTQPVGALGFCSVHVVSIVEQSLLPTSEGISRTFIP
uniref:Uncharacterized protein n=1 Tax=Aegilops tauschii TaxID=37682 RepID=M8AUG4_AEGTA